MPPLQERYYDLLMERVRGDRHPSHQLLDRLESSFWSSEQVIEYLEMLLEKVDDTWYPSPELLERVQRLLSVAATAA